MANRFLQQLETSKPSDTKGTSSDNRFLKQIEGTQFKQNKLPLFEGLGRESFYRIPALTAQGAGAAIAGEPGDILSLGHGLGGLASSATGQEPEAYEENVIGKYLPTSKKLLKGAGLQPRNQVEDFFQNLSHDATKLLLPGTYLKLAGKASKYALGPLKSLIMSSGANTLGKGVEEYTGSKEKGDVARHGSLFLFSLLNPQSAEKTIGDTYQKANQMLPDTAKVSGSRFENVLNRLEQKMLDGRNYDQLAPSEKWIIDRINDYRPIIQNGQLNLRQLVAQKRSTNEKSSELYNITSGSSRKRAKKLVGEIQNAAKTEMAEYGKTNPEWWKLQKNADVAVGAMEQSKLIKRLISPFLQGKENTLVAHLFGGAAGTALSAISKPTGIAGISLYKAAQIGYRIAKSPLLRKHYTNVLTAALSGNKERIKEAMNSLEKVLQHDKELKKED